MVHRSPLEIVESKTECQMVAVEIRPSKKRKLWELNNGGKDSATWSSHPEILVQNPAKRRQVEVKKTVSISDVVHIKIFTPEHSPESSQK